MGIIVSRFRKKQTTEEILDGIDKRVTELQKFRWRNQQLKKQYIGSLILYSIIFYIVAALVFFFYYLPETWKDRTLYSTPLLIFPVIVWLLKKFLHWYFIKRIAQNDIELEEIRSKKKQILEEVMEKETYKKAKEILEKYDPERFKKKTVVVTPKPVLTPASTGLRQRSVGLRGSTPGSGRGLGLSPGTTPRLPQGRGSPMQPRQIMSVDKNGRPMLSPYNQPPGPPLPRPVLPRERGKMDKLVEYFVGDGPQNRYALVCRSCHSHNGMALKEEFEYLTFRCCYCYQLNPARKQRPYAPKIDFTTSMSGTPAPKPPVTTLQQGTPTPGVKVGFSVAGKDGMLDDKESEDEVSDEDNSEGEEDGDNEEEDDEEEDMDTDEGNQGNTQTANSVAAVREQLSPPADLNQKVRHAGPTASRTASGTQAPLQESSLTKMPAVLSKVQENGQHGEINGQSDGSTMTGNQKIT